MQVFLIFLKLGFTSFGGPVAHIAFFREKFVRELGWFDDAMFTNWVALSHFLPGPSSSQLGFLIGYQRAGWLGALAAFIGFTLPSALIMLLVAFGWVALSDDWQVLLHGLLLVAALVVIQAIWQMGKNFCQTRLQQAFALISVVVFLLIPSALTPVLLLLAFAIAGQIWMQPNTNSLTEASLRSPSKTFGGILLFAFVVWLFVLPLWAMNSDVNSIAQVADSFYRTGAMVFGGGHVVLPLLQLDWVNEQGLSEEAFLTGYSLAQALPGPLFTFAAYLGGLIQGWQGALIATIAIFASGFLLLMGVLPFYQRMMQSARLQKSLQAIQAGVVGFLLAALIGSILPHAVTDWQSVIVLVLLLALWWWRQWKVWQLMILSLVSYALLNSLF